MLDRILPPLGQHPSQSQVSIDWLTDLKRSRDGFVSPMIPLCLGEGLPRCFVGNSGIRVTRWLAGMGVGVVFNGATDGLGRFYKLLHEISTSFLWISATVGNMFQVSKKQKLQILNIKIKTDECSYIYKRSDNKETNNSCLETLLG